MSPHKKDQNLDEEVIKGFGYEWAAFDYSGNETDAALDAQFSAYTSPVDLKSFDKETSVGADFGAGSGRWTSRLLPHFSKVYALEPSEEAKKVLVSKFADNVQIEILQESVGHNSIPDKSLDFAMSLGVLHHIPNTSLAVKDIASKIKPGGTFLCYLYYKLENKPLPYRMIFWSSNLLRLFISRMPYSWRRFLAKTIAVTVYLPLARASKILMSIGKDASNIPLHHYAEMPFVMLENDALDRFGTRLEQRFSKKEIIEMLQKANFDIPTLKFSDGEPFWTFSIQLKRLDRESKL